MKQLIKMYHISFSNAFQGLFWAVKTQPNFKTHIVVTAIVVTTGWYLRLLYSEWLVIAVLVTMGFVIETINTAIEATTDAITHEWRREIKIAKDVSAASMLLYVVGAAIIAAMIFIPKLRLLFIP